MGGVTVYVREALSALGSDASPGALKRWISENYPTAPQSQISLALRRLQVPVRRPEGPLRTDNPGSLFDDRK